MNSPTKSAFTQRQSPEAALQLMRPYCVSITIIILTAHVASAFLPQNTVLIMSAAILLVAIMLLGYVVLFGKGLQKLRFGAVMVHTLTYVLLVGGNLLHFMLAGFGNYYSSLDSLMGDWFDSSVAMGGIWGVGLFIHLCGAIAQQGFEITNDFVPRTALTNA